MTQREKQQVDGLRNQGYGYKKIAKQLNISVDTISSYCRRKAKTESGKCLQCGKKLIYIPKHKKKKFCSDKCRMAWWNVHQDEMNRKPIYKTCQQCGQPFDVHYNRSRKFCSRKCYADFRRKDGRAS